MTVTVQQININHDKLYSLILNSTLQRIDSYCTAERSPSLPWASWGWLHWSCPGAPCECTGRGVWHHTRDRLSSAGRPASPRPQLPPALWCTGPQFHSSSLLCPSQHRPKTWSNVNDTFLLYYHMCIVDFFILCKNFLCAKFQFRSIKPPKI